ncbi:MAG: hypothetical protein KME17_13040 [Cyanosarcina radialis HA8281-LM2]|jgi:catechol 2,3-dioxygenase-like lactoylglutathione lyase family enzyme|nr:hypothetical protein [Cyanosarcina radialis HA8281-LM2]
MEELKVIEIKAFVPAKNYELSKAFYRDLGFVMASDEEGIAYFYRDNCSFLLQDFDASWLLNKKERDSFPFPLFDFCRKFNDRLLVGNS